MWRHVSWIILCVWGWQGQRKTQNEATARETGKRHVNCQPQGWMEEDESGSETDYRIQTNKQVLALRKDVALPSHLWANTVHLDLGCQNYSLQGLCHCKHFPHSPCDGWIQSLHVPPPHPAYTFRSITTNLGTIYEDTVRMARGYLFDNSPTLD